MAIESGIIPDELVRLLNYRINQEELSSRIYYAMHEWLENQGYFGAGDMLNRWSSKKSRHAEWASEFLEAFGYLPEVQKIDQPKLEFTSLKDVIKRSYEQEIDLTEQCNDLANKAADLGRYCVMTLALQYLREQRDEVKKVSNWLDRLTLIGDDPREIMLIDREMNSGGSMIAESN